MKKLYPLMLLAFLWSSIANGQQYCNEWINFSSNQQYSNQQYFKVSGWRDGVYRITYADLQAAAFPMPFNPKQLQLFNQGSEQFIWVEGEADGSFDATDYIEFYGKKNDGSFDARLYSDPNHQLNKAFSLFTDTASYFLTLNFNSLVVNRRMVQETDINFIGYTALSYYISEAYRDYKNAYNTYKLADVIDSDYDEGEGWFSGNITNAAQTFPLPVPNVSQDPAAPLARANAILMGGNNDGYQHTISLDVNGTAVSNNFYAFAITKFNFPLSANSTIQNGTANFIFTPGTGVTNQTLVSNISITYPHTFSFGGENGNFRKMTIPGNISPGKSYISITNLNLTNPKLYMLSGDTLKQIPMVGTGTSRQALIPTYNADKFCFITDSVHTTANAQMRIAPVSSDPVRFARFINYQYTSQGDYLIITNAKLWNKANDYRNYRASTGFTPLLVDVDELYNQFAYGINKHPLSIRNFVKFANDTFVVKPQYLLLIGKSVSPIRTRLTGSNNVTTISNNWNANLLPSYGYPPSDHLLVSDNVQPFPRPMVAVGRISASTEADVQAYLDKITAHEIQLQSCPEEWMKRILHFGGGTDSYQQDIIKEILRKFEVIAEDTLMGANVYTFLKTSTDPIQVNLSQYLQSLIDSGVTMMTFVAHASGSTFDISTDLPQNYNNKNRYPLILANSCFVGDIHDPSRRIVEDFILLPEKGALAFVAQPALGYLDHLEVYSGHFYKEVALNNYGGRVGKTMLNVMDSILGNPDFNSNPSVYYMYKSVLNGMTLSGDPALILNSSAKPDYQINNASIFFTPELITTDIDSFDVNVVVKNLGRAVNDPFVIHITRKFPNGGVNYEKDTIVNYVAFQDTISIRLPVDAGRGLGPNTFEVYVDYFSNIDECNEANNAANDVPLLIQSSDILPVYPAEFAIVPNDTIELKASTVNPFAVATPYDFQIDTVDTFNSPFMKQTTITSVGGVVKWPLTFTLQPDLVYYWRVSRDSMPGDTIHPTWKESSFIHKPALTGWSQAHYSQFKKDAFNNIDYVNSYDSTFTFVTNTSSVFVRNFQSPNSFLNPSYEINNVVIDYQMCGGAASMHIVVLDSITLKPWSTDQYNFGNHNQYNPVTGTGTGRSRPEYYFIFRVDFLDDRIAMDNMLTAIPNGNYVIAYSVFNVKFPSWNSWTVDSRNWFSAHGSDSITFLGDYQPYIFFTKKGDNSTTMESIGDSSRTYITLAADLGGNWTKGFVNSVPIGPATSWTSFHWEQAPLETIPEQDSAYVDIIGIRSTGLEEPITGFTGIPVSTMDLNINTIDASIYPKLRLRAYLQDELRYTPPQLKRWQIYYDEIPELALNPARFFELNKDTLSEGEEVTMKMAIENIGNVNADSVLVDFYVYDVVRARHDLSSPRYKPLAPGDTLISSVKFSTNGLPGLNSLWIEANPRTDQLEQYHFNNLAEIKFNVDRDITNPILDVTFDGIHIMNGDIVSGKPNILIRLKDENRNLALNDTSDWQVFMKDPNGVQSNLSFEPLACAGTGTNNLKWCPATLPDNIFKIDYNPTLTKDGIYELWVQATDVSGNLSGVNNYKITFEVINKASITNFINYPNPFSTSTRFVFTLTGSEIPEYFKIQIMTVTGKIIREITTQELGQIRIGKNISEYAWDGKDEFGDQLANGVYLYRVLSLLKGSAIEKRETEADKFFTKGWGKMYLMR
ncbi:MAG: hypothetical protein IPN13_05725 [Bacteroidetes bacterium]|nr:hypothetical protein [Bacteroidota bacterium]